MDHNIQTFRDFLQFYNLMSQTCFAHCIDTFKTRDLEPHESSCVEKCANKLIRFNNRTISVYADIQTKLMTKRAEEMEAQQKLAETEGLNLETESPAPVEISSEAPPTV